MLYLIGLGLGDAKDITVKGLEIVRRCRRVYLEAYTSILTVGKEVLVGAYGAPAPGRKAVISMTDAEPSFRACWLKAFKTHPQPVKDHRTGSNTTTE